MKIRIILKKIYIVGVILFLALTTASCNSDFLSDSPNNAHNLNNTIENVGDMRSILQGAYHSLTNKWTFGRGALVIPDLVADNAFISKNNSGYFLSFYNVAWSPEEQDIKELWLGLYNTVAKANLVIIKTPKKLAKSNPKLYNQYLGEAYALRAMAHFTLADFFAASPKTSKTTLGIPYVKTLVNPNNANDFETPRFSLEDTYKAIGEDFNRALGFFDKGDKEGRQKQKVYLGPAAVHLLLSRLYLYNKQYDKTIEQASKAIDSVTMVKKDTYVAYWQKENASVETVFEIAQSAVDNNSSSSFAYIFKKQGYGQNLAYQDLVEAMRPDDVRRKLFALADERKPQDTPPGYYVHKDTLVEHNIKLLRISEAYLNKIEAEYYTGGDALDDLNKFAEKRSGEKYTSSGDQLLQDILKERRFELCFEGHRLFDLRRNKSDIVGGANAPKKKVPFSSKLYYLPIPASQIKAPNNKVTQNPEY